MWIRSANIKINYSHSQCVYHTYTPPHMLFCFYHASHFGLHSLMHPSDIQWINWLDLICRLIALELNWKLYYCRCLLCMQYTKGPPFCCCSHSCSISLPTRRICVQYSIFIVGGKLLDGGVVQKQHHISTRLFIGFHVQFHQFITWTSIQQSWCIDASQLGLIEHHHRPRALSQSSQI